VHSRVAVLLELLEAEMRDRGGLITTQSALRYLMTRIALEFSRQSATSSPRPAGDTSTSRLCASVKSLRIIDPSMPSTGPSVASDDVTSAIK